MEHLPIPLDPGDWCFPSALVGLGSLVLLAAWCFHASSVGSQLDRHPRAVA